jgi:hypothetical protein
MNKRAFLKSMIGKNEKLKGADSTSAISINNTLNPYTGNWGLEEASHLLRRTTYGPTYDMINQSATDGLSKSIENLFADQVLPDPPVYYRYENDPLVPLGETWVYTPPSNVQGLSGARRRSLNTWMLGLMNEAGFSIREKMVLFWHEHFPVNNINRGQFGFHYLNLIRENALGNFKTMVEEITISPAMLVFLNGNQNTLEAPNENYSRELLELFTIGKGEAVGPGDYTNYTEEDVIELAKALTGWTTRAQDNGEIGGVFVPGRHDTSTKQLSHRFNNAIIENGGENEYKNVIDIILQQDEVARFICRQLHIWFIGADINPDVEANIIEPMAQIIIADNYEINSALQTLLSSEYFFQESLRGCMISHPVDLIFRLFNTFEVEMPEDLLERYNIWNRLFRFSEALEMEVMNLPSVAGWKAFYQSPQFYEFWINSVSLLLRQELIEIVVNGAVLDNGRIKIDFLDIISKIEGASDPNVMIEGVVQLIFAFPISQNQLDYLKEVLIPGLPDFEWTIEYGEHLADPENEEVKMAVESKLQSLFQTMLSMPEFHLI